MRRRPVEGAIRFVSVVELVLGPKGETLQTRRKENKYTHIVLLDYLLKARVVQLRELGQIMHIGDDVTQNLLQHQEILIGRSTWPRTRPSTRPSTSLRLALTSTQLSDNFIHILITGLDPTDDLLALDLLEVEDLVELALQ